MIKCITCGGVPVIPTDGGTCPSCGEASFEMMEIELDSPNYSPPALAEFAKTGYARKNRVRSAD